MALKNNILSFWKQVKLKSSDMFTLFKVGVGVKVPKNKLHVKDSSTPLRVEGLANTSITYTPAVDYYTIITDPNGVFYRQPAGAPISTGKIYDADGNQFLTGSSGNTTVKGNLSVEGTLTFGGSSSALITVPNGGTGATTFTSNAILTGNGTSAIQSESTLTYSGEILTMGNEDSGPFTIKRTQRSGSNLAGGSLQFQAGFGTGSGGGGDFLFLSSGTNATATSLGDLQVSATLTSGGNLTLLGDLTISGGNITNAVTFDSGITNAGTIAAGIWNGTAIAQSKIADQAINEAKLQVSNDPTNGYMLTAQSGDTGGLTWAAAPTDTNTQNTTTLSFVDSSDDILLRNTTGGAGSGTDDIKFVAGSNVTLTHTNADSITIASTDTNTTYSVQDDELSQNNFTDADHTKLDGIEASADVTDTANVTAAGALMDSELTDLAGVKGVTISTLQVKPSEGAFANGDKTKLDGIEANATADQTQGEINALGITATGVTGATDSDVEITSDGEVTVKLDSDNDESQQKFKVVNNSGTEKFSINESGVATFTGDITVNEKITNTGTDNDLTLETDGSMTFVIDRDNDETSQSFSFKNFNVEVANLDEAGNLQIDGNLTLDGTVDGRDVAADGTKLDGIESGATADQTNVTGSSGSCTGNAATATALQTARNIGGVSFDGTSNIDLPGVSETGDQDTSGNAATATALTTGNKNITGTLGVTELITSKQRHLIRCGFYGNASRMYMPFNYGGTFESTSTSGYSEYGAVIMPCDGYVESVIIRSEQACGDSIVTVLVASNGTEVPTLSPGSFASPTVDMAADDTSYKFTGFVNQGGTSNSFSAGDVIMIAFDPTSSSYDTTATAVLVFDWNNQL